MNAPYQIKPASCKHKFTFEEAQKWEVDDQYTYELKEDGRRYLLQVRPNGAKQNFLTSRGISKKTGFFVEQQDTVTFMRDEKFSPLLWDSVFDGEIVTLKEGSVRTDVITEMKEGNVVYRVWDILFHRGDDLREKSYGVRRARLKLYMRDYPKWFSIVDRFIDPQGLMERVVINKQEGMVRKLVDGKYGEGWDKVKRADTWDVVIMGYEPSNSEDFISRGWIGSIIFGQFKNSKLVEIGRTSGFTKEFRAQISANQKKYLGRVIEVEAQEQLKSGALAHPRFKRLRGLEEKDPTECVFLV